jgi:phage tail sheath protein FI
METLHPGVYIQEVPSGVQPIEGVSTSTGAFIGKAQMGPLREPVMVTSMTEFTNHYGNFLTDGTSFLAHSVLQFFNNGGKRTYIVRIAAADAAVASLTVLDRESAAKPTLTIAAANEGDWGNSLEVVITDGTSDPDNLFNIAVYLDQSTANPPQPPSLLETLPDLSMDPNSPNFVDAVVASKANYIATTSIASAANATNGFSQSGQLPVGNGANLLLLDAASAPTATAGTNGPPATSGTLQSANNPSTNPPTDSRRLTVNLDSDGDREIEIPGIAATGADIAAAIQSAVRGLAAISPVNQPAYDNFTATYQGAAAPFFYVLTSGSKGATSSVAVGDSSAKPVQVPAGEARFAITINGDGPQDVILTGPFTDGDALATAIATAVQKLTPKRSVNKNAYLNFACKYDKTTNSPNGPWLTLTSGIPGPSSSVAVTNALVNNVATLLNLGLTNSGKEVNGAAVLRPANSQTPTEDHVGSASVVGNVSNTPAPKPGSDGATPEDQDYLNGLPALNPVQDVNLVMIPGIGSLAVVAQGTNYCTQRGDCFFIGDMLLSDDTGPEAIGFVNSLTVKSSYGAVYYPWLLMTDPTGTSTTPIPVPPSGFVAGMYAQTDAKRSVAKAPAGTGANLGGAVGLITNTTDVQQDSLNPLGVNVIRSFPASGIVIWGARTLATRSDPEYRYISVRRTAIFLEQSIYNGIQWAVFEPNDEPLWASLRLNITAFLMQQFRAGLFQGSTATDAFFVKVDSTTTTQADIDSGIVNILVGFAPLKPAEFVILRLTQKVNQPAS